MNEAERSSVVPSLRNDSRQTGSPDDDSTDKIIRLAPDIADTAAELDSAVQKIWPKRYDIRYTQVHVLLIRWEDDDLGVLSEIRLLEHVFRDMYNYNVETYDIPGRKSDKALSRRILDFLDYDDAYEADGETLLILYYGGHARRVYESNTPPLWFANRSASSPSVACAGIQTLLEKEDSDVLLLFDCCYSAPVKSDRSSQACRSVTEAIGACGFESTAAEVGQHSFSRALIEELAAGSQRAHFSPAELTVWILDRLKCWLPSLLQTTDGQYLRNNDGKLMYEPQPRRTPIHTTLCATKPPRSIMLGPLKRPNEKSTAIPTDATDSYKIHENSASLNSNVFPSLAQSVASNEPLFILQLTISLNTPELDTREWRDWIRSLPDEGKDIKVSGYSGALPAPTVQELLEDDLSLNQSELPITEASIPYPSIQDEDDRGRGDSPSTRLNTVKPSLMAMGYRAIIPFDDSSDDDLCHHHNKSSCRPKDSKASKEKKRIEWSKKSNYFWVWYCCLCNQGPFSTENSMSCPDWNCQQHIRCGNCPVEEKKRRSHR